MNRLRLTAIALLVSCALAACSSESGPSARATGTAATTAATTAPVGTAAPNTTPATSSPTVAATEPAPAMATAAVPGEPAAPTGLDGVLVQGTNGQPWWNDTVFYEVFVRSFNDSNGDGDGDLQGLIEKLDYLNDGDPATTIDLGVTGIWLMPVAESPSYHGYDVVDYMSIEKDYGTPQEFARLIEEAHQRGIRVIVDLVLNHTSSEHPWFVEAQDPESPKRDWYVWSDTEPEGKNWHKGTGGWYYGFFGSHMPDLNYHNPEVTAAMEDVIRFWLEDKGVDGFRLDAVKHLFEEGRLVEHAPNTFEWLEGFYTYYKDIKPDAFTVGEAWADSETVSRYVGDKVDVAFEFTLAEQILQATLNGERDRVLTAQENIIKFFPPGQYATFLANHDQNRTRSRLFDDEQSKTAASLQLLFSGVPFVYYGEEIGMQGQKPDENIRRPMQWTAEGGFTNGEPWNAYFGDEAVRNVVDQDAEPNSLLNHYRQLIRLRSEHEALRVGGWVPVEVTDEKGKVYAAIRSTANETVLVLLNLGSRPVSNYKLDLAEGPLGGEVQPSLLMGPVAELAEPAVNTEGGFDSYRPFETLPPSATFLIQLAP